MRRKRKSPELGDRCWCSACACSMSMLRKPAERCRHFFSDDIAESDISLLILLVADLVLFAEVFDFDDVITHGIAGSMELGAGSEREQRAGSKEPETASSKLG